MEQLALLQTTLLNVSRQANYKTKQIISKERLVQWAFNVSIVAVAFVFVMALLHSGISTSLVDFILVGAIPNTTYSVPPTAMLIFYAGVVWLLAVHVVLPPKPLTPYNPKHAGRASSAIE